MKKSVAVLMLAVALVAGACGAKNQETGSEGEGEGGGTATTEAAGGGSTSDAWGDLESPCGEGDFSVEASEAGSGTDKLYIGVANDRTSTIRPGLNKELWDASQAMVAWCNDQGGLGGLPIEIVDVDAKLLEVEPAMAKACNAVFALVGGGMVQDNMQFSGKDTSDVEKCGIIDIPAIGVSVAKSSSDMQVQPVPHPANELPNTYVRDFKELYPEESKKMSVVWGDLPSMRIIKEQAVEVIKDVGGIEIVGEPGYPVAGMPDWTPLAQKIIDSGATSLTFVGEPTNLSALLSKLREQGWKGVPLLETNAYDEVLFTSGDAAVEGALIRDVLHPLEEADEWPAIQQYIDTVNEYVSDGKIANLGLQSVSAWLLFLTAAKTCGDENDGVLTRQCVLDEAAAIDDWTAGGTHAPTDPDTSDAQPTKCGMLLQVKDGKFVRFFPEIGGEGDDGDGFHCPDDGVTTSTKDFTAEG